MAGQRQPIALVEAKGKKHLTKREIEDRRAREVKVPFDDVKPPEYLTTERDRAEFMEYAGKLKAIGIFTELDEDCLGRYIVSQNLYLEYTKALRKMIKAGDIQGAGKIQTMQDKAFKQCHTCASALGLTITSRCKIEVPKVDADEDFEL